MGRSGGCHGGLYGDLCAAYEKIDHLEKVRIPALREEMACLRAEVRRKDAEILRLREALEKSDNEVSRLKSVANNTPANTSLAPSQGQIGVDPHSHRPKAQNEYGDRAASGHGPSKRGRGGQKSHRGSTLTRQAVEKFLLDNKGRCEHEVVEVGDASCGKCRKKYVIGIRTTVVVKEYRYYGGAAIFPEHFSDVTYDSSLKALAGYCYGECNMPTDKIGDLVRTITGEAISLSEGSCYNFCREISEKSAQSIAKLESDLMNGEVLYTDATYTRQNGKEAYVRNASDERSVVFSAQETKRIEDIGKTAVLGGYRGTVMADHETSLKHFGRDNAECNQHLHRYCRKNKEQTGHEWGNDLMDLLYKMKDEKQRLFAAGAHSFSDKRMAEFSRKYDEAIRKGWGQSKDPKVPKYARDEERALLRRLEKYKDDHLRFATNFKVEFTNNTSEKDLRFIKGRTKVSGGFRQTSGRKMCCDIMSVIRSCKKRGIPVFAALVQIASTGASVF